MLRYPKQKGEHLGRTRSQLNPARGDFQLSYPERKNEVQCQEPSLCIWLSLLASAMHPPPQDKDKDKEMPHMLGRGGRWGPIRDRKQGAREKNAHPGICGRAPLPPKLSSSSKNPRQLGLTVTRGFYIPYHICFSKNPGGKESKDYYPPFY